MALVKTYRSYPIHRDRDGTYTVEVGKTESGVARTEGQFETARDAEEHIDEILAEALARIRRTPEEIFGPGAD